MRAIERFGASGLAVALLVSACSSDSPRASARVLAWDPQSAAVREGGISDLTLDPSDSTRSTFFAINDRGPNDAKGDIARFPEPAYHQKIFRFRLIPGGGVRLVGVDSIRSPQGRWTTGLPSPLFGSSERAFARASDGRDSALAADSAGFDFEGLAHDDADGFWASEEYGPRIVHMRRDSSGLRIERSFAPGAGLPEVFGRRARNKGLEALCRMPDGNLVAMFQGALDNAVSDGKGLVAERSLARRILVLDPVRGGVREYLEQVDDDPRGKTSRRTKTGACAILDDGRILELQHRKKGKGRVDVDVRLIDLAGATDVHLPRDPNARGRLVGGRTLEEVALDPDGLARAGIKPVGRTLAVGDLTGTLPGTFSKPEGMILVGDSTLLVSFDNDFGIQGDFSTRFLLVPLVIPAR